MAKRKVISKDKQLQKPESTAISKSTLLEKVVATPPKKDKSITGIQKVAILMVALGSEVAASIIQKMNEEEIALISAEIANVNKISSESKEKVLNEFHELLKLKQFITKGGSDTAKEILAKAFGDDKADKIISNVNKNLVKKPFGFLNKIEADEIILLLKGEHPQTIALILSYLDPGIASQTLKGLPQDIQSTIAKRIAMLDRSSPEAVSKIEKILAEKLSQLSTEQIQRVNGINTLAEILNNMDRTVEKNILESIEEENEELAEEIKEKMFLFEDVTKLSDRDIQKALELVSNQDIALALKGEEDEFRSFFFSNISKIRKKEIDEEIRTLGRVRYRDVYSAQQKILNLLKILEAKGDIYLKSRTAEDYVL